MKKYLYLALGLSLLFGGFYFSASPVKAQSCNPEALVPVSYGQRGSAVRNAQACLMEAGYDIPAGATGYYGEQTRRAVQAFYQDWYGNWDGRRLGPRGVAELKSRLAAAPEEGPSQPSQPSQPSSQDQVSALVAAVLAALQQMGLLPSTSTQQQAAGEEGFLTVDKDPTVAAVTLREGESGRVVGLRFRADNGEVRVQSIFLRWTNSVAPHRVISALRVVDSQGNVLYQTNVGPNTFLQDSSLNYYLPISGLNVNVPKNGYASVFVEVTVVGTLPSGVGSLSFAVNQNDVRGRDGAGIDRFGPSGTLTWSATLQPSLAGNARFVLALNPNTPKQGYVFGDPTDGRAYRVKVLSFDVTARNDNLRVTRVEGSVTNTSTVQAVYLAQGNNVMDVRTPDAVNKTFVFDVTPANFTVNRDQTVTFDVLVDFVAPSAPIVATFTVSVATTTGVNSLGDIVSSTSTTVTSEMMRAVRVGPRFAAVEKTISVTRDQNNSTTTVQSVVFRVNVTAVGGPLYVPDTNTATITLETVSGTTSTVSVAPTAVRVGTTLVSASGGYYTVPEGATYEFEFRTSGQTFPGAQSVRARLSSFVFDNDTTSPAMDNSSFLHNLPEFWTNWSN
jgi:peptidoglycan hydrolase-like protein with peptidoglycan-binding domain